MDKSGKNTNLNFLLAIAKPALSVLLQRDKAAHATGDSPLPCTLFFTVCNTHERARTFAFSGPSFQAAWRVATHKLNFWGKEQQIDCPIIWLRVDAVDSFQTHTWQGLQEMFVKTKRNYFPYGIAFRKDFSIALLREELDAHELLYDPAMNVCVPNKQKLQNLVKNRFGNRISWPNEPHQPIWTFTTQAVFTDGNAFHSIESEGKCKGYRQVPQLDADFVSDVLSRGASYMARQVQPSGRFAYGWRPCFDMPIARYNALHHASATRAMLECWEVTQDSELKAASHRALEFLCQNMIQSVVLPCGEQATFLVEKNNEIKLGGNALCLLAFVKYVELTNDSQYFRLMEQLALGIWQMQNHKTGNFIHVMKYPGLEVKEGQDTISYEGQAAFSLLRLYALSRDLRWLNAVEKSFDHFIFAKYWETHDHWLSCAVNEITKYKPEERYYRFGLDNVRGRLDFVLKRITTYPTLLMLMMSAQAMLARLQEDNEHCHLLQDFDLEIFNRALTFRTRYLLNGHFWPELAMFFQNPAQIVESFFIRHHGFQIRIDEVGHYLSGYAAYWKYLNRIEHQEHLSNERQTCAEDQIMPAKAVVAWGGDVNLGRRQHYRTDELGFKNVLGRLTALKDADLRIVNLECVVSTLGEQGFDKGEGGPYYYRARPEMLRVLTEAGIDVVVTANNHSGDYGPEALLDQGRLLDALGIGHTGSGSTMDAALTPVIRRAGDLNVAIFAVDATLPQFTTAQNRPGIAYLPLSDPSNWKMVLAPLISAVRQKAHVVLVAVHWGLNMKDQPSADKISVGRAIIDAGADAVLGANAHMLHGVEVYMGRPIIHDAGDLLFDAVREKLEDTGVFRLELSSNGAERVNFVPAGLGFGFSIQRTGREAILAAQRYAKKCEELGTQCSVTKHGTVCIDLQSQQRISPDCPPAEVTKFNQSALDEQPGLGATWVVSNVPEDARIPPLKLGPLYLLGVRVSPSKIIRRRMLWVESFWSIDRQVGEDYRIDLRAVPVRKTSMPAWGNGLDHDPCDWMMPTSRWQVGVIYRDYYGLRPPTKKYLKNVKLRLEVGLITQFKRIPRAKLLNHIEIEIP